MNHSVVTRVITPRTTLSAHISGVRSQMVSDLASYNLTGENESAFYESAWADGGSMSLEEYWSASGESRAQQAISLWLQPVLLAVGGVGNLLCYAVLRKRLMARGSVYFYLGLYALMSTLTLYLACGLDWLSLVTHTTHLANQADWLCRLWHFVMQVVRYSAAWLVLLMVFDRFIYLCLPARAHSLCTVFTAKVLTSFAGVVLVAVAIHAMWTFELNPMHMRCAYPERRDFQTVVWPVIAVTLQSYAPLLAVFILDILIMATLAVLSSRNYQSRDFSPVQQQLTHAVLGVSVLHLVLTLPQIILNLVEFSSAHPPHSWRAYTQLLFTRFIFRMLILVRMACICPVYFIALPSLRAEFMVWLNGLRTRHQAGNEAREDIEVKGQLLNGNNKLTKKAHITHL